MSMYLHVLRDSSDRQDPSDKELTHWAITTVSFFEIQNSEQEFTIRIVDKAESARINKLFRDKNSATNVLAFPFCATTPHPMGILGDLLMCAPIIREEAEVQGKEITAHWAHTLVHGLLHLLGFDHKTDSEAKDMEALETTIMLKLGFPPPYEHISDSV
jgi:probable rRNA maturation factor